MTLGRVLAFAKEALLLELALYRCLARWVVRRPSVPPDSTPFGYAQLVGPMLWLWIFGSATEVVVVEVILQSIDAPWAELLRTPLLVLGIWGVLWMVGLLASYRVRPHLLDRDRLLVRNGARTWVEVPLEAIASTRAIEHELPGTIRALHQDDDLLLVGVPGRTNVEVTLRAPTPLRTSRGTLTAAKVGLWVDEPRLVAERLRAPSSTPR